MKFTEFTNAVETNGFDHILLTLQNQTINTQCLDFWFQFN